MLRGSLDGRQVLPEGSQRGVLLAGLQQHPDHRQPAVPAPVHQVQLCRRVFAFKGVLARRMKVKLDQLVAGALDLEAAARIIRDLDRVAIVHHTDLGLLIME